MKPLRPVEPRGPLFADDINAERAEVDRLGKLSIDGPAGTELQTSSTGMQVTVPAGFFGLWARVDNPDGIAGGPWGWKQLRPIAGGQFEVVLPERQGTPVKDPLYHPEGSNLRTGTPVFIVKGAVRLDGQFVQQDWLVIGNCCGSSESLPPPYIGRLTRYQESNGGIHFEASGVYAWDNVLGRWVLAQCLVPAPSPDPAGTNCNWFASYLVRGVPGLPGQNLDWVSCVVPRVGDPNNPYIIAGVPNAPAPFNESVGSICFQTIGNQYQWHDTATAYGNGVWDYRGSYFFPLTTPSGQLPFAGEPGDSPLSDGSYPSSTCCE